MWPASDRRRTAVTQRKKSRCETLKPPRPSKGRKGMDGICNFVAWIKAFVAHTGSTIRVTASNRRPQISVKQNLHIRHHNSFVLAWLFAGLSLEVDAVQFCLSNGVLLVALLPTRQVFFRFVPDASRFPPPFDQSVLHGVLAHSKWPSTSH